MKKEGATLREIGAALHVSATTVWCELKRGSYTYMNGDYIDVTEYILERSHQRYLENLAAKGPGLKIGNHRSYAETLERLIVNEDFSPSAALHYCHPYSSSERGSNEKQNQMIRRKFPKGTNFDNVTKKEVDAALEWLNNYPRQLLGWCSSNDLFQQLIEAVLNFFTFCYAYLLTFALI